MYTIPVYIIPEDVDIDDVYQIFTRVNFAGTRLRSTDIYLSLLEIRYKGLSKKVRQFTKKLKMTMGSNWDVEYSVVTKTFLAFLSGGKVKLANTVIEQSKALDRLAMSSNVEDAWKKTEESLFKAIEFLKSSLKINGTDSKLMPSQAPLVTLSYYMGTKGELSEKEKKGLTGWYLLANFFRRYSSSTDTRLNEDLSTIDREGWKGLIKGFGDLRVRASSRRKTLPVEKEANTCCYMLSWCSQGLET